MTNQDGGKAESMVDMRGYSEESGNNVKWVTTGSDAKLKRDMKKCSFCSHIITAAE